MYVIFRKSFARTLSNVEITEYELMSADLGTILVHISLDNHTEFTIMCKEQPTNIGLL